MTEFQSRWLLDDVFVLDSTVHGYNILPENIVPGPFKERVGVQLSNTLWEGHRRLVPPGQAQWALSFERFQHGADPVIWHAVIEERQVVAHAGVEEMHLLGD